MKYLITGGAGFIGSNLVERLISDNEVVVIDSFNDYYNPDIKRNNIKDFYERANFSLYELDICKKVELDKVFEREKYFDCIIHLAGTAGVRPSIDRPAYYYQENTLATINILECMRKYNLQNLIYFSSSSVYGNSNSEKFMESDITDFPVSPYAASKKSSELIIYTYHNNYKINAIILRPFTVYGPKMRPDLAIYKFVDEIINNKEVLVYGDGMQKRDYTYITDLIDVVIRAVSYLIKNSNIYEIINVASSSPVSIKEVIEVICKKLQCDCKIIYQSRQVGDVVKTYGDITKAKKMLGFVPKTSFDMGIEKYISWYLESIKPKIIIYTVGMMKGGTERVIANIANNFVNYYKVVLVTNIRDRSSYYLSEKIKYINIDEEEFSKMNKMSKIINKIGFRRTVKLKEIIDKEKPDLVFSFLPEASIRLLSIKKYFDIPFITSIRNMPKYEFKYPFLKLIRNHYYKKSDKIIIQDISYMKYLPKCLYHKFEIIPNYVSKEFLEYDNTKKEDIIISVSRLERQKNVGLLIKSFAKISNKFKNYKLYIYGEGSNRKRLERLIKKMGLIDKVYLEGNKDNIKECLEKAKIFVLVSNYEGFPNSLIEAMALNLPVIATKSTPVIEKIINNNKNGLVIKKNSKRQLIKSLEYLLVNEYERDNLGRNAGNIKRKYSEEDIMKLWMKVVSEYVE